MDYDLWINKAIMKIGELDVDTIFVLKDLFTGVEWNELQKGEKSNLGRKFKIVVENGKIPDISLIESPKGTSNTYKKLEKRNFEDERKDNYICENR